MSDSENVIHKSKWAITTKNGNYIYKMFLHNNLPKIEKEIKLFQISTGIKPRLYYNSNGNLVCESKYIKLSPLFINGFSEKELLQLNDIFIRWNTDIRYINCVIDEWQSDSVPFFYSILKQYIPSFEESIDWLKSSKADNFIHGDFTLSNVFLNSTGNLIVLDFENAMIGPKLWDETTFVYSLIENSQYEIADRLFTNWKCNYKMLKVISEIRLALSFRKAMNVDRRLSAYKYITQKYNVERQKGERK